jgi:lactoylglutathione lyase
VPATLRLEIFPADLDATADFYCRVLNFRLVTDQRLAEQPYLALLRDEVRIGAAARPGGSDAGLRRPPVGVEIVLEVDDLLAERARVTGEGWPLEEDVQRRPWGLLDFRILDPDGHYLRLTNRSYLGTAAGDAPAGRV